MRIIKDFYDYNYKPDIINKDEIIVRYTQNFLDKNKIKNIKNIINKDWIKGNPVAFEVFNDKLFLTEGHHRFEASLGDKKILRALFDSALYYKVNKPPKYYKRKKVNFN
jgi:hypothetical protein